MELQAFGCAFPKYFLQELICSLKKLPENF